MKVFASTGDEAELFSLNHPSAVTSVLWSPDGKTIVSSAGNDVFLWSTETNKLSHKLEQLTERANKIVFSSDGRYLGVACDDNAVHAFSLREKSYDQAFRGHTDAVEALAFHPLGKHIVTGSRDTKLRVFHKDTQEIVLTCEGHTDWVTAVDYSPNGRTFASASFKSDQTVRLWNSETGTFMWRLWFDGIM